jgi:exonuclease SbcD
VSIQVLLTADNHLDPSAATFGVKRLERKADFLRSFESVIEYAVQNKPDIMIIAGDLYDSVVPRNPPRTVVMRHLKMVHEKGTKIILISGHHDTPRSVEQGASPLAIYGDSGYAIYVEDSLNPKSVNLSLGGEKVQVFAMSFNPNLAIEADPLASVKIDPKGSINLLTVHYPIEGFRGFYGNEPFIHASSIPSGCQLVAAGHLHEHQKRWFGNTLAVYPGSTERRSFLEEGEKKGFVWLDIDKSGVQSIDFIETPARKLKSIVFNIPRQGDMMQLLKDAIESSSDPESIVRIKLKGSVSLENLTRYKRFELISYGLDKFFSIEFDESEMELQTHEALRALPRTTPLQELRRYFESLSAKLGGEEVALIQEARTVAESTLSEAGAW